jgi:hypothetical protein
MTEVITALSRQHLAISQITLQSSLKRLFGVLSWLDEHSATHCQDKAFAEC